MAKSLSRWILSLHGGTMDPQPIPIKRVGWMRWMLTSCGTASLGLFGSRRFYAQWNLLFPSKCSGVQPVFGYLYLCHCTSSFRIDQSRISVVCQPTFLFSAATPSFLNNDVPVAWRTLDTWCYSKPHIEDLSPPKKFLLFGHYSRVIRIKKLRYSWRRWLLGAASTNSIRREAVYTT